MDLEEMKGLPSDKQKELFKKIDIERAKGKTTNYACVYGAGGKKIAESADLPEEEGFKLWDAYWDVNWSVKQLANDQKVKVFYKDNGGNLTYAIYKGSDLIPNKEDSWSEKQAKYNISNSAESMWLWNPVSKFWYSLRFPKDIFSTLNQGTGVFCFDTWVANFMGERRQLTGQMHDEVILTIKKGFREQAEALLRRAIDKTNEQLKLNRELGIDVQFGDNYAQIH